MIPDKETNKLYLADILPKKYPSFFKAFKNLLLKRGIEFSLLPHTKDVWAVDYMPIQISKEKFVQFVYNPSYLYSKGEKETISDVNLICEAIFLDRIKSQIVLDGGNVTRSENKVIMCDRIFTENKKIPERDLIKQLENIFEVDSLIFIPTHPVDFTGHSDGIVRFLDENTVLINEYPTNKKKEKTDFARRLRLSLHNAKLDYIEIPYNPYDNDNDYQAVGEYINYLQMKDIIILPIFGIQEDEIAIKKFEEIFRGYTLETIKSNDLANDGGILNCITWNIAV